MKPEGCSANAWILWIWARSPAKLTLHNPQEITDLSELRRLMNEESDSRKFYKLAELSTYFEYRSKEPFLPERARGLSLEGRAADRGQSTVPEPMNDIAGYTYYSILASMDEKNDYPFWRSDFPDFEVPGRTEKEKYRDLAVWLKENWPGCESLELPSTGASVKKTESTNQSRSVAPANVPIPRAMPDPDSAKVPAPFGIPHAIFFASGLLAISILWYFLRRK